MVSSDTIILLDMPLMDPQLAARFKFIDFLLLFKGRLTRTELVSRFGVGEATASRTIASYQDTHPDVMVFLGSRNGYEVTAGFVPSEVHNAEDGLRYLAYGTISETFAVETFGPDVVTLQAPLSAVLVGAITRAIVNHCQVNIEYSSATSGQKSRMILPHSLFKAGGGWYFRAYDYSVSDYRTFKFTRILSAILLGKPTQLKFTKERDSAWHRIRYVQLIPHPKSINLESHLLDLGMPVDGVRELPVSEACLGFVLTDLRVDCSKAHKLDPKEYPLALANSVELEDIESMSIAPGFQRRNL